MAREFFKNLPNTTTPLTAPRLNGLLDGDEPMGNIVVDSVRTKNLFNINGNVNEYNTPQEPTGNNIVDDNVLTSNINGYSSVAAGQRFTNLNGKSFVFSAKIVSTGTGTAGYLVIYDNGTMVQISSFGSGETGFLTHTGTSNDIVVAFATVAGTGAQYTDIQVEIGSVRTDYAPFQNLTGQEIYSINEIQIGTWINGKPIYRKCYQLNKTASELIIEQINDLDVIVNCNTYLKRNDNYKNINNFYSNSNDYGSTYVDTGNIIKYASTYTGTLYIVIEYTKTTD